MAYVYDRDVLAGELRFDGEVYIFLYSENFLKNRENQAISLTLPKQQKPFISKHLHPFFSNLLAEGNIKKLQCKMLKIDENDEFTRLIKTAIDDTIISVSSAL